MIRFALCIAALMTGASFALAQDQNDDISPDNPRYRYSPPLGDGGSAEDGARLIERGAGILFRNLMNEMAPEIGGMSQDLGDALSLMGPALSDLSVLVDDIGNYQTPERLENGDIILRRKAGAPPPPEIGDGLQNLTRRGQKDQGDTEPQELPTDPDQPEINL